MADDDLDDDLSTTTGGGGTTGGGKSWDMYVSRFLPLERAREVSPAEVELAQKAGLSGWPAWEAQPEEVRLNILRAYAQEQDRVGVTAKNARDIVAWRDKFNVSSMLASGPLPGSEAYFDAWPTRITTMSPGDKFGHPILFDSIADMNFDRLLTMDEDDFFRFRTQALESLFFAKKEASKQRGGVRVSKHVYILDLKGLTSKHMSKKIQDKLKPVFSMSSNIFPEILWSMWIINAPMSFRGVWNVVRNFVDPVVRSKIRVFGPTQAKWHKAMDLVGIPVDCLPVEFGGKARSETLREVLLRSRFAHLAEGEVTLTLQNFFKLHDPSHVDEIPKLMAMYDDRSELLRALQDKYVFTPTPYVVRATFGPGPLGMVIKGRALHPPSASVVGHAVVEVIGWAPPGADKSLGQGERMGTIALGDIIAAVGDTCVLGWTEAQVKQKLVEAPRPLVLTLERFAHT